MAEYLTAVNSFPVKSVIWELVKNTPGELLCDKEFNVSIFGDLRQLRTVSKSVWKEEDFGLLAKLIFEEVLAIQELSIH